MVSNVIPGSDGSLGNKVPGNSNSRSELRQRVQSKYFNNTDKLESSS